MKDVKEIFTRIQDQKKEQREINKMVREALDNSAEYRETLDSMKRLRTKKYRLEDEARGNHDQKLELLKLNIKQSTEVMSDVALTKIMKGESIKLVDEFNNEYEPIFSVRFKKTVNKSYNDKDKKKEEK